ncbi:PQQ-binding-like beta-propeller repeat protein [Planctomicrobium sp. SH661]|uniref:PQQ-like beta-propeller repeat protein n=1 Tax=Planctomicrobium sp. SH661 TaxID=3448124 RepID=UPI003F5C81CA
MRYRALFLFWLSFAGVTLSAQFSRSEDWPQWRGPHRNGQVPSAVPYTASTTLEELWQADVQTGFSSIAISQGRVLTVGNADNQDTVWCLSLEDGSVLWKQTYPAPLDPNLFEGGPTATPTVEGGNVYVISRLGEVHCFDLATGEIRWHVQVPEDLRKNVPTWGYSGSALVVGERLYFNAGSHGLCLNAATGEVIWASDSEEVSGYTSPLLMTTATGPVLLIESEKTLNAVNPETGEVVWRQPWITRYGINAADPLVLDEHRIVVTSGYGKGASLIDIQDNTPNEVWRSRDLKTQMSPGVLIDGFVYANDGDADRDCKLVCLDANTGKLRWLERGFGSASLIAVGKQLLVLSESGELNIVEANPDKLEIVAKLPLLTGKCWTPPAFTDSKIVARNATGKLTCVRLNP